MKHIYMNPELNIDKLNSKSKKAETRHQY